MSGEELALAVLGEGALGVGLLAAVSTALPSACWCPSHCEVPLHRFGDWCLDACCKAVAQPRRQKCHPGRPGSFRWLPPPPSSCTRAHRVKLCRWGPPALTQAFPQAAGAGRAMLSLLACVMAAPLPLPEQVSAWWEWASVNRLVVMRTINLLTIRSVRFGSE